MDPERPYRCNSSNSNSSAAAITTATAAGELLICFTSRLSSSSTTPTTMKIPSSSSTKPSIVSPGRAARGADAHQISLSNSLSRRLRSNGSMRGGQASPMFSKKRGCNGFENAEPSSPKVTCIGQVRVKSKKQGKRKTVVRGRSVRGEASFRRIDNGSNTTTMIANNSNGNGFEEFGGVGNNNFTKDCNFQLQNQQQRSHQRWVHLPLSLCEALREFNCFLPCRSSCMASEKEKAEKLVAVAAGRSSNAGGGGYCGAVFARWFVAEVDGGGAGKEFVAVNRRTERETERSVLEENNDEEEEEEEEEEGRRSYRRHVFEGIEFKELEKSISSEREGEEASRVSICIPPKNALLLMRCRSDPVRMTALANKLLESETRDKDNEFAEHVVKEEEDDQKGTPSSQLEAEEKEESEVSKVVVEVEMKHVIEDSNGSEKSGACGVESMFVEEHHFDIEKSEVNVEEEEEEERLEDCEENEDAIRVNEVKSSDIETAILMDSSISSSASIPLEDDIFSLGRFFEEQELHNTQVLEPEQEQQQVLEETDSLSVQCGQEDGEVGKEVMLKECGATLESASSTLLEELEKAEREEQEEEERAMSHERSRLEDPRTTPREGQMGFKSMEKDSQQPILPDCLLLMMCEPKLSMEVSKETWVCSTDFIRWLPDRRSRSSKVNKKDGGDETKKRISIDLNAATLQQSKNISSLQQPPRSSCSYPARPPQAKAAGGGSCAGGGAAGAMIVLTRCKSEPHRQANKLAPPESCFWKNRKLEPIKPSRVGIGSAKVN